MKYLSRILSLVILISAVIVLTNCGGSDDPAKSAQQTAYESLAGTWTITSAKLDGVDQLDYVDATLNLAASSFAENKEFSYTFIPTDNIEVCSWAAAGSWSFSGISNPAISFERLDSKNNSGYVDIPVTYGVSGNTLTIEFDLPVGQSFSRAKTVDGEWRFTLTK